MEISSSTAHQHQKLMAGGASSEVAAPAPAPERKPRPQADKAVDCPRCRSTNTKFCYYNNYSMSQPRYFCKACRRYWTQGGSLRNVPVGGGCRKNRRSAAASKMISKPIAPPEPMAAPSCSDFPAFISTGAAGFEFPPRADQHGLAMSMAFASPAPPPSSCGPAAAMAPAGAGATFLDILRGGFLDGSDGLQYGGGGIATPPLPPPAFGQSLTSMLHQHGLGDAAAAAAAAAAQGMDAGEEGGGEMAALRWLQPQLKQEGEERNIDVSVRSTAAAAMDKDEGNINGGSSRDYYWSNGAANPWQGLINSSSQLI